MILHHYCLSQPNIPIELGANSTILQFARTNLTGIKRVLYTTTESYADADLANQMLSITYYPKFDTIIDVSKITNLNMVNNNNKSINSTAQNNIITRVWPAFGKTGGSHEFLILAPDKIQCTLTELANGGAPDEWHQDKVANYDPDIAKLIATSMIDALVTTERFGPPEGEGYSVKAVGNGVATNSSLQSKNVTLSAAWKNLTSIPEFKFWACLWSDDDKRSIRTILHPCSEKVVLNCPPLLLLSTEKVKEYIKWDLEYHGYVYSVFTEIIRSLLSNILLVSDEFFDYHSHKIVIPT
jgi:hypothetical protein